MRNGDESSVGLALPEGLLDQPVWRLLTSGGDPRLLVEPATGLNAYGCSPRPRPEAITFASCTASSISEGAYAAAEACRQGLRRDLAAGRFPDSFASEAESVRARLARLAGAELCPGSAIILTPSGTDAELLATALARRDPARALVSVLVGQEETGSGVVHAAAGRHFAARTALGVAASPGEVVAGMEGIALVTRKLRDPTGRLIAADEVETAVEHSVEQAVRGGAEVLLHVLDVSKTGLVAPSFALVRALAERHGTKLSVVVDACQFRTDPATIARYLAAGFLVLVTGSKFFTGPPFAGALLLPPDIAERACRRPLPAGLAAYATRDDLPPDWHAARAPLSLARNVGELLRWEAALFEMTRFCAVPAAERRATLAQFAAAITARLAASARLQLLPAAAVTRGPFATPDSWDGVRTIFPFTVRGDSGLCDLAALQRLHRAINLDLSDRPECLARDRMLAAQPCHIGQPVRLHADAERAGIAALRVAGGARLVSGVAFDPSLGADPPARLAREIGDAITAIDKIELLLSSSPAP